MVGRVCYLDANASTPIDRRVLEVMHETAQTAYANPGSSHQLGRKARQVLEQAREEVARILGARSSEVIFTSGATEATNLGLRGLAAAVPEGQRILATTGGEHPATSETVERLCREGWRKGELPLLASGELDISDWASADWSEVGLVAVLAAHNETGVLQDLEPLREVCQREGIVWHVDVVQAVGRIPVDFSALGASAATVGVHKCHGPRGIGALLLREGIPFVPGHVGGFQEAGRRPGTEAVALAAGMACALRIWEQEQAEIAAHLLRMRERFEQLLTELASPLTINGQSARRLPNTSNIRFAGVDVESLLIALDLEGICCSLGSACASGSVEPSPVLLAMGQRPEEARSSMRFSLHRELQLDEVEQAARTIAAVVQRLREWA